MPTTASPQGSVLHLLGHFDDPHTGAERDLQALASVLQGRRPCSLWSDVQPHPQYAAQGVRPIRPFAQEFPKRGTLLLGGVHVALGVWLQHGGFERIVLRYNLPQHERLFQMVDAIRAQTGKEPELAFVSRAWQLSVGLPGAIEHSLISLDDFLRLPLPRHGARPFTIGRLSRDVLDKHHPDDVMLYRMLAAQGVRIRIMGGTCLAPWLDGVPGIELLAAGALPAPAFLEGLDAFFYRTGAFAEAYGRVVFEAMAAGLPVVLSTQGGFAEQVANGASGLLFDTQEEAFDAILRLRDDRAVRLAMGMHARQRALELHGPASIEALARFYLH